MLYKVSLYLLLFEFSLKVTLYEKKNKFNSCTNANAMLFVISKWL